MHPPSLHTKTPTRKEKEREEKKNKDIIKIQKKKGKLCQK